MNPLGCELLQTKPKGKSVIGFAPKYYSFWQYLYLINYPAAIGTSSLLSNTRNGWSKASLAVIRSSQSIWRLFLSKSMASLVSFSPHDSSPSWFSLLHNSSRGRVRKGSGKLVTKFNSVKENQQQHVPTKMISAYFSFWPTPSPCRDRKDWQFR